jgi:hypothetical protein
LHDGLEDGQIGVIVDAGSFLILEEALYDFIFSADVNADDVCLC